MAAHRIFETTFAKVYPRDAADLPDPAQYGLNHIVAQVGHYYGQRFAAEMVKARPLHATPSAATMAPGNHMQ